MPSPALVAHRGYAARYPENTRSALAAAVAAGARYVEIDVQLTRDEVPVLFHDRTLERMCALPGAVHEQAWPELRLRACGESAKFGARFESERVLELAAFAAWLREHPDVQAFVELKRVALTHFGRASVLQAVLPLLAPVAQQCSLISFDLEVLELARRSCALPLGAVFDRWEEREQSVMDALQPEFVFCDVDGLPADGSLRHQAARTVVYEVADPALARALAARGVELVETFAIAEMRAALAP